ncbi:AEC family malonate efflux carrier [Peptoclostridium acidaminophilum DSM 3953]|uniref:AEC family malonate efflux carrier n=1 Tax=Peptoclostridium acidaminophilum DSM 3953 TaxID=1286171 RepID=W8TGZ9_PEPAC|nr:AEC family transporter [Peptoclostridium acidaminophilum]AHM57118.1 AEC family malonate efflux carrier [Peptoclostridium acidaminophilum DSM 3953]
MISALESIASIFIVIAIGYGLLRSKLLPESASGVLNRIVFDVSIPMLMVTSVYEKFTREMILGSLGGVLISIISVVACYIIARVVFGLADKGEGGNSVFSVLFSFSNTIFMGLPICVAILGQEAATYALIYYFANTTLFWTMGLYFIKKEAKVDEGGHPIVGGLVNLFSAPFAGFLAGLALVFTDARLPEFIFATLKSVGGMATPMSLIIIGMMISRVEFSRELIDRKCVIALAGKFIVLPLLTALLVNYSSMPVLMKKTFVLQAAMPIMAQSAITAKKFGVQEENASFLVGISTALSIVVIPLYVILLQLFYV